MDNSTFILKQYDYTMEELEAFDKFVRSGEKRVKAWGTLRNGKNYMIPYEHIKIGHVKNIIKWIKNHPQQFSTRTLIEMEDLYRTKLENLGEIGKLLYGLND